jgi:hypothetical protein
MSEKIDVLSTMDITQEMDNLQKDYLTHIDHTKGAKGNIILCAAVAAFAALAVPLNPELHLFPEMDPTFAKIVSGCGMIALGSAYYHRKKQKTAQQEANSIALATVSLIDPTLQPDTPFSDHTSMVQTWVFKALSPEKQAELASHVDAATAQHEFVIEQIASIYSQPEV